MAAKKMVNLSVEETSGVDHPAHLAEGWVILKQASRGDVTAAIVSALTAEEAHVTDTETIETEVEKADETVAETETAAPAETETETVEVDELAKAHERIAELEAQLATLTPTVEVEAEDTEDALLKAAPAAVVEMLQKARDEADAVRAELRKERDAARDREFIAKARGWQHLSLDADAFGPMLRQLTDLAPEVAEIVGKALDGANAQAESGAIFEEIGKPAPVAAGGSAYDRITSLAKSAVDAGEYRTIEQAVAGLVAKNPDLYHDYLASRD